MDVETLLNALDNKRVQDKIRKILSLECDTDELDIVSSNIKGVNRNTNEKDDDNLIKVQEENDELKNIVKKLKSLLSAEEKEKSDAITQMTLISEKLSGREQAALKIESDYRSLNEANVELHKKLGYYRDNFGDDVKLFELYSRLSEQTRVSLSGIFKDTTIQGLMACGIQEKNISNLWDYLKNETINGVNDDVDNIVAMFLILFNRFRLAYPMFELQNANIGDTFDTECHIKHNSSVRVSGSISQIILQGYVNTKTGKVIKPSVVTL